MSSPKIRAGQYIGQGLGGHIKRVENIDGIVYVTIKHVEGETTCFFNARGQDKRALRIREGDYAFVEVKCELADEDDLEKRLHELERELAEIRETLRSRRENSG